jgi:hypothetical protein
MSPWDGYFLRGGPTPYLAGGSPTHSHGPGSYASQAHAHGAGSFVTAAHSLGGFTGAVSITINGSTSSVGDHQHPFSSSVAGTTGAGSGSVQTADAGGSFQVLTPPHNHNFSGSFSGDTGFAGGHSHTFGGSGSAQGSIASEAVAIAGASGSAGAMAITGASDVASHIPPYIDLYICQKD